MSAIVSENNVADLGVYFATMKDWLKFQEQNIDRGYKLDIPASEEHVESTGTTASRHTELASCDIRYAIGFSLICPLVVYAYTGRFKAFGVFLVVCTAAILSISYICSEEITQSKKFQLPLSLSIAAIAAADNSQAILSARRRLQGDE